MNSARRSAGTALALCLAVVGCDTLGPSDPLGRFDWAELEQTSAEASQFTQIGLDVLLIGDINTPTSCFRLSPDYQASGTTATLRIRALATNRTGCSAQPTTYRYNATLRNLEGMTDLRVVHDVEGEQPREYNHSLDPNP
ncbi:MAG TPA: hypothetical protein VFZ24_09165 [Longimicrobiales bacterium]